LVRVANFARHELAAECEYGSFVVRQLKVVVVAKQVDSFVENAIA
jgi:hypothetical protein